MLPSDVESFAEAALGGNGEERYMYIHKQCIYMYIHVHVHCIYMYMCMANQCQIQKIVKGEKIEVLDNVWGGQHTV